MLRGDSDSIRDLMETLEDIGLEPCTKEQNGYPGSQDFEPNIKTKLFIVRHNGYQRSLRFFIDDGKGIGSIKVRTQPS